MKRFEFIRQFLAVTGVALFAAVAFNVGPASALWIGGPCQTSHIHVSRCSALTAGQSITFTFETTKTNHLAVQDHAPTFTQWVGSKAPIYEVKGPLKSFGGIPTNTYDKALVLDSPKKTKDGYTVRLSIPKDVCQYSYLNVQAHWVDRNGAEWDNSAPLFVTHGVVGCK